jgi:hypothetical protein
LLLGYADLPPADLDAAMRIFGECLRATPAAQPMLRSGT